eukprot:TRINITY_DN25681_c0_g1_i1.p1 TRINITY_DN25681_c0_g1~~TRINITY_DN25681_c0_g1_i1.p1  ORF type:complete len:360 (+),score=50.30 TRINITY_DN25681_c0_g1_i1:178-1257(+)
MRKKLDTRFPAARIKKIMQADEEVGKIALATPVLISKALEIFLQDLCDRTYEITCKRGAKTLASSHLKQCISSFNEYDFLKDVVAKVADVDAPESPDDGRPGNSKRGFSDDDVEESQPVPKEKPKEKRRLVEDGRPEPKVKSKPKSKDCHNDQATNGHCDKRSSRDGDLNVDAKPSKKLKVETEQPKPAFKIISRVKLTKSSSRRSEDGCRTGVERSGWDEQAFERKHQDTRDERAGEVKKETTRESERPSKLPEFDLNFDLNAAPDVPTCAPPVASACIPADAPDCHRAVGSTDVSECIQGEPSGRGGAKEPVVEETVAKDSNAAETGIVQGAAAASESAQQNAYNSEDDYDCESEGD